MLCVVVRGPSAPERQELFRHLLVFGDSRGAVQTCLRIDEDALAAALETRCVPWPSDSSPSPSGYSHP